MTQFYVRYSGTNIKHLDNIVEITATYDTPIQGYRKSFKTLKAYQKWLNEVVPTKNWTNIRVMVDYSEANADTALPGEYHPIIVC